MLEDTEDLLYEALEIRNEMAKFLEDLGADAVGALLGSNFLCMDILIQYGVPLGHFLDAQPDFYRMCLRAKRLNEL
ncbi:MAG TPA: hypothetical protein PL000_07120 [Anaerolineales bacterium]|nr:hypothetical protein [Anaerolineales bacterium]